MLNKTEQLLAYIVEKQGKASVTSLMKLCYFIDLGNLKKTGNQISDFEYKRYKFGPFDARIYQYLEHLLNQEILCTESDYTYNDEYLLYSFNENNESLSCNGLTGSETEIIDEVLENLKGYGARTLTDIAYITRPMQALGATLGGSEHLNEVLNLRV